MTELKTITFQEYLGLEDGAVVLMDLDSCPDRVRMDYATRNENLQAGRGLCPHCDGTGNELFACFRRCPKCWGMGINRGGGRER